MTTGVIGGIARSVGERARTFVGPGEISLRHYLFVALLIRIPAVFLARGYEFIDHQYQYVDPAYGVAFDASWWQPYDYLVGLKCWVYPGFLAAVFKLSAYLGVEEAGAMMTFTRFVHALISLIPVAAFWLFLTRFLQKRDARPLLLFLACNPIVVFAGVQPNGVSFALGLALTAILLWRGERWIWPFLAGLALGLAFACRVQDSLFGPVLFAIGLMQRRFRATAWFTLGCSITVCFAGLVDYWSWGRFLASSIDYTLTNLGGEAAAYGRQPVWTYLLILAGSLLCVPPFLRSTLAALRDGIRQYPVLFACGVAYVLVHNLLERKAIRFIFPALVLITTVFVAGLLSEPRARTRFRVLHRRLFYSLQTLTLILFSISYFHRGPVEAARALSRLPDFQDRLLLVDGGHEGVGGHFYLRREQLEVTIVPQKDLTAWFTTHAPETPTYIMVYGHALAEGSIVGPWRVQSIGYFASWPRESSRSKRFIYRIEKLRSQ